MSLTQIRILTKEQKSRESTVEHLNAIHQTLCSEISNCRLNSEKLNELREKVTVILEDITLQKEKINQIKIKIDGIYKCMFR